MAIRGMDTQIMVTRSTDVSKDATRIIRAHDTNQDQINENERVARERDQRRVMQTQKAEKKTVTRKKDDEEGAAGQSKKRKKSMRQLVDMLLDEDAAKTAAAQEAEKKQAETTKHIDIKI